MLGASGVRESVLLVVACLLLALLCRDWERSSEGIRAETSTWHRLDPPCQPAALYRLVHPKTDRHKRSLWRGIAFSFSWYTRGSKSVLLSPLPQSCGMFGLSEMWGSSGSCVALCLGFVLGPNNAHNIHQISIRGWVLRLIKFSNAVVGQPSRYSLILGKRVKLGYDMNHQQASLWTVFYTVLMQFRFNSLSLVGSKQFQTIFSQMNHWVLLEVCSVFLTLITCTCSLPGGCCGSFSVSVSEGTLFLPITQQGYRLLVYLATKSLGNKVLILKTCWMCLWKVCEGSGVRQWQMWVIIKWWENII